MIIGLIGPRGVGKSTLAEQLSRKHGLVPVSFGSLLKGMLFHLLTQQGVKQDLADEMIYGVLKEKESPFLDGRSARYAMQTLGTEWGRELIGPDFWVNAWKRQAARYKYVVADDVRFLNEAQAIWDLKGKILLVERLDCAPSEHRSEREFLSIPPNGTVWNFENKPEQMLETLQPTLEEWGLK